MANTQVTGPPSFHVPTFIPLVEAAQKYNLSEKALTQLIQTGKIEAVQLPNGELLVAAESNNGHKAKTKQEIIAEEFSHLRGNTISASEASRKYSKIYGVTISNELFSRWSRLGYIKRVSGYRLSLDEADVAYCAKIFVEKYHEYRGRLQGVPIFDENGNPYHLKYREVAAHLRAERQTTNKKKRSTEGQNSY
ncbi:MAG: hypothetical protein BroJett011_39390 [Chloroflexota bacterium]|nr:MAG: hypothetical protein BroJett011_39390 [Chloroflexota bacterium]